MQRTHKFHVSKNGLQEGGFASTNLTDNGHKLTRLDGELRNLKLEGVVGIFGVLEGGLFEADPRRSCQVLLGDNGLGQELLEIGDGIESFRHSTNGLGEHDEGETQNVEKREHDKDCSRRDVDSTIGCLLSELVGDEHNAAYQRGGPKHHRNVHRLDDGIP
jgi:hypothetical protein